MQGDFEFALTDEKDDEGSEMIIRVIEGIGYQHQWSTFHGTGKEYLSPVLLVC